MIILILFLDHLYQNYKNKFCKKYLKDFDRFLVDTRTTQVSTSLSTQFCSKKVGKFAPCPRQLTLKGWWFAVTSWDLLRWAKAGTKSQRSHFLFFIVPTKKQPIRLSSLGAMVNAKQLLLKTTTKKCPNSLTFPLPKAVGHHMPHETKLSQP